MKLFKKLKSQPCLNLSYLQRTEAYLHEMRGIELASIVTRLRRMDRTAHSTTSLSPVQSPPRRPMSLFST